MQDSVTNKKFNIVATLRYADSKELKHFENEESLERLLDGIVEANRGNYSDSPNKSYYNVRFIDLSQSTLPSHISRVFLNAMDLWRNEDSEKLKQAISIIGEFELNKIKDAELQEWLEKEEEKQIKRKEISEKLIAAVESNNLEAIKDCIANGADMDYINDDNNTALIAATYWGRLDVAKLLIEKGADVNQCDKWDVTPLMIAAHREELDITKYLIEQGAYVNARSKKNTTALDEAMEYKNTEIVYFLIQHGAKTSEELENSNEESQTIRKRR